MVYVLNQNGQPLMPMQRYGKVRRLLRDKLAIVKKRCPFTIQLLYEATDCLQDVTLGIDAGTKHIGLSACTEQKELYAAEALLRTDIPQLLSNRREIRCSRRNRKTRYRKPRFENRVKSKRNGWLAPSVRQKIESHLKEVKFICQILPVKEIVLEVASFDSQRLKADILGLEQPEGTDYQKGEQLGFWNVREYVLTRDGHQCQCCHGKTKDKVLNVHHIVSRKTGGNAPNNLVTLCRTCHEKYHKGLLELPDTVRRSVHLRDAAVMGIMKWRLYDCLKERFPEKDIRMTFGYLTKNTRIRNGLEKSHVNDARCISGSPNAVPCDWMYLRKHTRRHNRQLHKCTIGKGGTRKANQAPKYVFGYQLFDKVSYKGQECFVFGRRSSGSFDIRLLDGTKVSAGVSYKKLQLLETRKTILTERRAMFLPIDESRGFRIAIN